MLRVELDLPLILLGAAVVSACACLLYLAYYILSYIVAVRGNDIDVMCRIAGQVDLHVSN